MGSHSLLQGISLTQGLNLGPLYCRQILYHLSYERIPISMDDDDGLVAQSCLTLVTPWTVAHQVPLVIGFSGKNTGVGCHFLLQGIFLTQGSNPGLLHCRQILY